jgi:hypothetical protein
MESDHGVCFWVDIVSLADTDVSVQNILFTFSELKYDYVVSATSNIYNSKVETDFTGETDFTFESKRF